MAIPRVIVVTGANRGIGRAICQEILARPADEPVHLVATSRAGSDLGLAVQHDSHTVSYGQLDLASSTSINNFRQKLTHEHDRLDVLINNAGINLDFEDAPNAAKTTLDINYRGTLEVCKSLLPQLSATTSADSRSRIVTLSSIASSLRPYSNVIARRFRRIASEGTLEQLEELAKEYEAATPSDDFAEPPRRSYAVSKACVNAMTSILARENPHLLINACCPGWIATDMGSLISRRGTKPPKTPAEGAQVPVHLALGDIKEETGKYWANDTVRSKGLPEVREW